MPEPRFAVGDILIKASETGGAMERYRVFRVFRITRSFDRSVIYWPERGAGVYEDAVLPASASEVARFDSLSGLVQQSGTVMPPVTPNPFREHPSVPREENFFRPPSIFGDAPVPIPVNSEVRISGLQPPVQPAAERIELTVGRPLVIKVTTSPGEVQREFHTTGILRYENDNIWLDVEYNRWG